MNACIATASLPPANLFVQPSVRYPNALPTNFPNFVFAPVFKDKSNLFASSEIPTSLPNKWLIALPIAPSFFQIITFKF